jgi:hypothetical protein
MARRYCWRELTAIQAIKSVFSGNIEPTFTSRYCQKASVPSRHWTEKDNLMKTILLAASAMLCIGVGVAYADGGDDEGGAVANTFFTELPGVVATAPGAIPNDVAVNGYQTTPQYGYQITTTHAANTWTAPGAATVQR